MADIPGGHREPAVYIANGAIELRDATCSAGRMLVLGERPAWIQALERSSVMLFGGEPVGERFVYRDLVSSSRDRLAQAAADWKVGRMKLPDADDAGFIPLPAEHTLPEPAMS